jgi:hypothetical protein
MKREFTAEAAEGAEKNKGEKVSPHYLNCGGPALFLVVFRP